MADDEIRINNIGVVFESQIMHKGAIVDISSATSLKMMFQKPNGELDTQDGMLTNDGTDGLLFYKSVDGDIDVCGKTWRRQAMVVLPSGTFYSDIYEYEVFPNLEAVI